MSTSVVLLGTGNPNPDPKRSGPSVAVIVDNEAFIVDAGPGLIRRAAAAYGLGIEQLRTDRLGYLFLTHLHSDHTIGLPDILLTPWVMERKGPLNIFGPAGTEDMVKHITYAYEKDINVRRKGLEKANDIGWRSVVKEIGRGTVFENETVRISAFNVKHTSWDIAFGYRFETRDGTIVISGDCSPTPDLIDNYSGADILVHEVYSTTGFKDHPEKWKAYHSSAHTSSKQLSEIASLVRPRSLVLYHTLLWGAKEDDLLEEIRQTYDGEVILGNDLDIIHL
jgi:ribonuclease BN (tRNA processing enzyme)